MIGRSADPATPASHLAFGAAGTFVWDVTADRVYADAEVAEMFEIRPELARHGLPLDSFFQRIHPQDYDRVVEAVDRAIQARTTYSELYAVVRNDGRSRVILARGACYAVGPGEDALFPGSLVDVTDMLDCEADALARIGDLCLDALQLAKHHRLELLDRLLGMTLLETGHALARAGREAAKG